MCVCVCVCVCAKGKLSSKLHINENNTDILLYQIYLPKLHKDISKLIQFIFKKSPLASAMVSRRFRNLLQAFPTISCFELPNAAVILAFSSSLLLMVSCSTRPTHNN